jgi:hypothetical protein
MFSLIMNVAIFKKNSPVSCLSSSSVPNAYSNIIIFIFLRTSGDLCYGTSYWFKGCRVKLISVVYKLFMPISVAAPSKACVFNRLLAEIAGSNPTGVVGVCLLWVSYVGR